MTDIFTQGTDESRVWIDDVLLQDEGIAVLLNSEEPALPSLRNLSITVPGRHGAYDFGAYFEPRQFTLNVVFPRQSYADLKYQIRQFNRKFVDDYGRPKTVQLRFGDEPDKYYNVRITDGISVERVAERGFLTVNLTAYDPYAYSIINANEVTWGSEVVTFEWTYLLGMSGTGGGGVTVTSPTTTPIYVDGEALRPVIEISGKADGLTISSGGKSFSLPNFTATEWIIDGENYVVLRNGVEELSALTGDFIELLHGDNDVVIGGTNMDFEITVKYRDKYI